MANKNPSFNDIIPYSSIYIDMPISVLVKSFINFCKPINRDQLLQSLEKLFIKNKSNEKLLATLCVRTSLDLIWQAYEFPPGSEVLMTCVNIPQMSQITRFHGLIPVPIDIDFNNLKPSLDDIKSRITPQTKALMISYIYGAIWDPTEIINFCKKNNIIVIEDIAEAFIDTDYNGHPDADFSLFSFGTIKNISAFGGSITICRNNMIIYQKMKNIMNAYPMESNFFFMKRILKNILLMFGLNNTFVNKYGRILCNSVKLDYKEVFVGLARGFNISPESFLLTFRKNIPNPMLSMLNLRMSTMNKNQVKSDRNKIYSGQQILVENGVEVPGAHLENRHFWLFPILTPDAKITNSYLNAKGVDAYLGATQLKVEEAPLGSNYKQPKKTKEYFDRIIYLPIHKGVPEKQIKRICLQTVQVMSMINSMYSGQNKDISAKL